MTGGGCRSGFTIVELLVALMVLVVGVLGLSAAASVVASNLRIARLETQARFLAQSELERVLAGGSGGVKTVDRAGQFQVAVDVGGADPRHVRLTVSGIVGSDTVSDTLITLLPW